jgi:hypothetical protein
MSFNNFIPTVWSAQIARDRARESVAIKNCNTDYEGEIADSGDRVEINTVPRPTISNYVKDITVITPENLQGASTELIIDQSKYFCFEVDDIDKRQAKGNLMDSIKQEAAAGLSDVVDSYIFGKYAEAGKTITATSLTSVLCISTIMSALEQLWKNNVPKNEMIVLEVSPSFYTKMVLAKIINVEKNDATLTSGYVGKFLNFEVFMSNNIYSSGGYDYCFARTKKAISFAGNITKTEAFRPQSSFSDAIKGLDVFGAKVIRPKELVVIKASFAAETTI